MGHLTKAAVLVAAMALPASADAARISTPCPPRHWVGSWAAAPSDASLTQPLAAQTARMIVSPHLGGRSLRIHLSNRLGTEPVTLGPVSVARRAQGAELVVGSRHDVLFGGRPTVTIPAGEEVVSDAVGMTFAAFDDLAVSVNVPQLVDQAHQAGLRVLLGTITPAGSTLSAGYDNEPVRQAINHWIRDEAPADGVADFDAAVKDPADPTVLAPQFDGGDGLHMSPAGYAAMADAVTLSQLALPKVKRRVTVRAHGRTRRFTVPAARRRLRFRLRLGHGRSVLVRRALPMCAQTG